MTESTSHVEQQIAARLAAARIRVQAAQERRASLAEARRYGIARRHAAKLRHLSDAEQRQAAEQDHDDRASVRTTDGSAEDTPSSANTTEGATP